MLLSLGMLFILAKIAPFGDAVMNVVQFINELFIFVALILLMPLANNLTNLVSRNNVGWCLYGVLLLCIIFNILILLIRACSIMCQYIRARNKLVEHVKNVKIQEEVVEQKPDPEPFRPAPAVRVKIESYVRPQARDFPTFGFGSVTNSIQSLHKDDGEILVNS